MSLSTLTTAVMVSGVFWDVTPCGSCKDRCFGERIAFINRMTRISMLGKTLAVTSNWSMLWRNTTNIVPSSLILVALMMEAIHPSKTLVLTRATWHDIPGDSILHSHWYENLRSYTAIMVLWIRAFEVFVA
jgi:hypothetical protein